MTAFFIFSPLLDAATQALQNAGKNPDFPGAETGVVAVLHTRGQTPSYHPHIHILLPADGLTDDGMKWVEAPKKFFVPVKALSAIFRGILVKLLKEHLDKNKLKLPGDFPGFN